MINTPFKKATKQGLDILVISLSGMGDVLLFTPALHLLKRYLPFANITVLVKFEAAREVLENNKDVDRIEVFDPLHSNLFKNIRFYLRQRLGRYDISISTFPALSTLNNLSTFAIGAKKRWTYNTRRLRSLSFLQNRTIPYYHGLHRIDYNLQLVRSVLEDIKTDTAYEIPSDIALSIKDIELGPIDPDFVRPVYHVTDEERSFAKGFLLEQAGQIESGPSHKVDTTDRISWIGMHPGSGGDQPFKRWGEKKFANLASQLQSKYGCKIILFGGRDEVTIAQNIASHMISPPIIATGRFNIRQTTALIEQCRLFISNDSGLMHLAEAVGTEVIGIFGPTDETNTGPVGKNDKTVILTYLPCKPKCRKRYLFDKRCSHNYSCLRQLKTEQVLNVISKSLHSHEQTTKPHM